MRLTTEGQKEIFRMSMSQTNLTDSEREVLFRIGTYAGGAVSTVSWSGISGQIRENYIFEAGLWEIARQNFGDSPLLQELAQGDGHSNLLTEWADIYDRTERHTFFKDWLVQNVPGAVQALTERATAQDTNAYKRWVLTVCENVARTGREGDLLGTSGKSISEDEQKLLAEIAALLQMPDYQPPAE
jgi:hypothetical protein